MSPLSLNPGSLFSRSMITGVMTLLVGLTANTSFGQSIFVYNHAYGPDNPIVRDTFSWNSEVYLPPYYTNLQIRGWYNANTIQGDSGWRQVDFNDIVTGPGDYYIQHRGMYTPANERYVDTLTQMTWFADGVWNYWQSGVVRIYNPYFVGPGGGNQVALPLYPSTHRVIERKGLYSPLRSLR